MSGDVTMSKQKILQRLSEAVWNPTTWIGDRVQFNNETGGY